MWTQTPTGQAWMRAVLAKKDRAWKEHQVAKRLRQVIKHNSRIAMRAGRQLTAKTLRPSAGKRVRRVSKAKAALDRQDAWLRIAWWMATENHRCAVPGCKAKPTERHHCRGRTRKLQNDTRYWAALCAEHHRRVKDDPAWAKALTIYAGTSREQKLLADVGRWMNSEKE